MSVPKPASAPAWHLYVPKLVTVLRGGYGLDDFRHDLLAGRPVASDQRPSLGCNIKWKPGNQPDWWDQGG